MSGRARPVNGGARRKLACGGPAALRCVRAEPLEHGRSGEAHEVDDRAFAQLCKYSIRKEDPAEQARSYDLYRVCLQDNRILNAVERAHSFIRLESLMLYIAVHELVHVIRFGSGQADFNAPADERLQEEEKVNKITRSALHPVADKDMGLVLDCFSNKYDLLESYG